MNTLTTTAQAPAPIETREQVMQRAKSESLISPRFYTTDFAALERMDMSPLREQWEAMLAEYEGDNNHDHFTRDEEAFRREVRELPPELHQEFLDFLITSITSEFSGCVLYNEIRKRVDNPDIKRLMTYLTRDESRHANFINHSLRDYGLGVDLANLKATKATTYFKPKYILYATTSRRRSATRATSPSTGSSSATRTSASTRSSGGSSAGATTNSGTARASR